MRLKIALKTTNKHAGRVRSCLSTWLGGLDYVCVTDRVSGLFEEISCGTKEDYESAEEKTCNFFIKLREGLFSEYDWVMLIDDDAMLNHGALMEMLPGLDKGMVHGYDMTTAWPEDKTLKYPSGGGGYLVSPSLVASMPPMNVLGTGIEDVRVGLWMSENSIDLGASLPLGPWFPFGERYWDFKKAEEESPEKIKIMVEELAESDREFLRSKITHHHIRWENTMRHLYEIMMS